MAEVQLLVVSDLHAVDTRFPVAAGANAPNASAGRPSWLDYSRRTAGDKDDPLTSLFELISREPITADYLVVPGDICDRANGMALRQAWAELEDVRQAIGARLTIATAGNHDLDSRYRANTYDPRAALMQLQPPFPVIDDARHADFWAYGIAQIDAGDVRFVIINSCAYHGGAPAEISHGRISPHTLRRLTALLSEPSNAEIDVLVCHHHPHPFPSTFLNAGGSSRSDESYDIEIHDDRMIAGEDLLHCLDATGREWLLIHGHRHLARLAYAAGSTSSPVVLAAGSAAVRLDPVLAAITRNQAHHITLTGTRSPSMLRGIVHSWDYSPGIGWKPAADAGGLPGRCGFGFRGRVRDVVSKIERALAQVGGPLTWEEILVECPEIQYLTPSDLVHLRNQCTAVNIQLISTGNSTFQAAPL